MRQPIHVTISAALGGTCLLLAATFAQSSDALEGICLQPSDLARVYGADGQWIKNGPSDYNCGSANSDTGEVGDNRCNDRDANGVLINTGQPGAACNHCDGTTDTTPKVTSGTASKGSGYDPQNPDQKGCGQLTQGHCATHWVVNPNGGQIEEGFCDNFNPVVDRPDCDSDIKLYKAQSVQGSGPG